MEFRPAGLGIMPPVVKNLLLINVIVYAATKLLGFEGRITELFALHHWSSPYFKVWQPLTHMFMHFDNTHIFSNMFALWMFGSVLENRFGSKRFLNFYLISGIGASILYLAVVTFQYGNAYFAQFPFEVLGASGAVFGILFGRRCFSAVCFFPPGWMQNRRGGFSQAHPS